MAHSLPTFFTESIFVTGRSDSLVLRVVEELEPHSFWAHEPAHGREGEEGAH